MTTNKSRKSIVVIITGIIVSVILIGVLKRDERTTPNIISIIGTLASLVGLGITYVQVKEIKSISEANKLAINETKKEINFVLSLSESVLISNRIRETQGYLRDNKLDLALLRMQDLKNHLVHFKGIKKINKIISYEMFISLISDITIDISSLSDSLSIIIENKNVDFQRININLENMLGIILEFEQQAKNEKINN